MRAFKKNTKPNFVQNTYKAVLTCTTNVKLIIITPKYKLCIHNSLYIHIHVCVCNIYAQIPHNVHWKLTIHFPWATAQRNLRVLEQHINLLVTVIRWLTIENNNNTYVHVNYDFRTTNNNMYLIPSSRTMYHQNFFFPRTITLWNSLPREIQQSDSLNSFKKQLLSFLF